MKKSIILMVLAMIIAIPVISQKRLDSNLLKANKAKVKNDIKINSVIYLDDNVVESDDIILTLINLDTKTETTTLVSHSFTLYLKADTKYAVKFTKLGYNCKTILINTECPTTELFVINLSMYLYSYKPDEVSGVIYYSQQTDNFECKPYNTKN